MEVVGHQRTLPDFDLFDPLPLHTDPPVYLHTNDPPATEPTLLLDPPLPTPPRDHVEPRDPPGEQAPLTAFADGACPVCHRQPDNVSEHLLTQHADVVNDRLAELKAERDDPFADDRPAGRVVPKEPAMFGEVETDTPGERLDAPNPRECNDCGTVMSVGYKRIFGHENGDLWCPDCKPRAQRYTNDPARQHGSYSAPANTTGTDNPRYNYEPNAELS